MDSLNKIKNKKKMKESICESFIKGIHIRKACLPGNGK
jgi:hypothetical protein